MRRKNRMKNRGIETHSENDIVPLTKTLPCKP